MINTKEPKELNNTGEMVGEIFQEFNDMTLLELQHIYPVLKKDIESLGINEKVRTLVWTAEENTQSRNHYGDSGKGDKCDER